MAQLDDVAVGVAHVQSPALPLRAPDARWAGHDVEPTRRFERVEVLGLDHHADVIDVLARAIGLEQVDDRRGVDADRRKEDLAPAPLLDALGPQAELVAVPRDRALDFGDSEHHVIKPDRAHALTLSGEAEQPIPDDSALHLGSAARDRGGLAPQPLLLPPAAGGILGRFAP